MVYQPKERHYYLSHYALVVVFLVMVFYFSQLFSFPNLVQNIRGIRLAIMEKSYQLTTTPSAIFGYLKDKEKINENLETSSLVKEKFSDTILISDGLIDLAKEINQGAKQGSKIALDLASQTIGQLGNVVSSGFTVSYDVVGETIIKSNKQVLKTGEKVAAKINQQSQKPIAQADSAKVLDISALAFSSLKFGLVALSNQVALEYNPLSALKLWTDLIANPTTKPLAVLSYQESILPIRLSINSFLFKSWDLVNGLSGNITLAWTDFYHQLTGTATTGDNDNLANQTDREKLKQEIIKELQQQGVVTFNNTNQASTFDDQGVILIKPTGSSTLDLSNIKNIKESFSDRVIIDFSPDGQSGVLQPVFRNRIGEKYIFLITPVKQ